MDSSIPKRLAKFCAAAVTLTISVLPRLSLVTGYLDGSGLIHRR